MRDRASAWSGSTHCGGLFHVRTMKTKQTTKTGRANSKGKTPTISPEPSKFEVEFMFNTFWPNHPNTLLSDQDGRLYLVNTRAHSESVTVELLGGEKLLLLSDVKREDLTEASLVECCEWFAELIPYSMDSTGMPTILLEQAARSLKDGMLAGALRDATARPSALRDVELELPADVASYIELQSIEISERLGITEPQAADTFVSTLVRRAKLEAK